MPELMQGQAVKGVNRPSTDFGPDRICADKACNTKLSRYNRRDHCYAHAPVKYPRVRGRIAPGGA